MSVRVIAVADAPWEDVRTVFGTRGDPATCWCQFFKVDSATWKAADPGRFERALCSEIDDARAAHQAGPGVLAYDGEEPVGWAAVEPRSAYRRILTSKIVKLSAHPPDQTDVWSVTCFVVRTGHRRGGVARALLDAAVDQARAGGARIVEAYPVDATTGASSAELYHGPLSIFEAAGFDVVARDGAKRAVVQLAVR
ncbi:MAG: GNAT family N-acetyltransferase [Pseudolysinimonas sp.]